MRLEGKSRAGQEAREVLENEREEKRRRNPVVILAVHRAWGHGCAYGRNSLSN